MSLAGLKVELDRTLNESASSLSKPEYEKRWRKRFSQELLNEYLRHEISGMIDFGDFEKRFYQRTVAIGKKGHKVNLYEAVKDILVDEGRFGQDAVN